MKFGRRAESPIDDQFAEADIQDRLQLANALRQKSMEGASLENVGGHLIGSPVARALTSFAQGVQGAGERKRAYNMATDLATSKRERLAQALSGAGQEPTPEARLKRGMELMGHPDPQAQAVGQYMAESAQKEIDQRQKTLDTQRGEINKDLRHMQDLYQRDQAATRQAGATKEAAQIRADAIKARGPAAVPGTGTLYPTAKGYVGRKPDGSWGYITVGDGETPVPGAYDPNNKQDMALHAGLGKADATYWATRPAAKAARDSLMTDLKTLRDMPGFTSVFGAIEGRVPDVLPDTRNARAQLNKVIGGMTAENRQKLVGQGSVSDYEGRLMERASTVLSDPSISDEMALAEVNKILDDLQTGRYAPDAPSSALPDQPGQPTTAPQGTPAAPSAPAAPPAAAAAPPPGIDPEDWKYLSPEEQAAFHQ